jgi:hypothetical protein
MQYIKMLDAQLIMSLCLDLIFKGNPEVKSTGQWDLATFNALANWQKEKGLPASGILDARTIEALGLHGLPEPKASTVVASGNSGGSHGNNSGAGSAPRSSTPAATPAPAESNPWSKAVQDRISRGGSVPGPPGFPFGN